eukprot:TRINITY_DN11226_c0_g1_i1.p1 TRINITY_DN11226_c0_g1~~TRINITY_DN11226_c0_g1_i1.p1  ORF type:complete len:130 (+),score=12.58 TRINITY_DN11226_c0_g1_i1:355-744(+)
MHSTIKVMIVILQSDGGVKSAVLNAVTLALLDAGIEMNDIMISCQVGMVNSNVYFDLTKNEENLSNARLTVSLLVNRNKISFMEFESSKVSKQDFEHLLRAGNKGCLTIYSQLLETIRKSFIRRLLCSR